MTLGNMRSLGVHSLAVTCELCHHETILGADVWPDAVLVQTFAPRMVCSVRDHRRRRSPELARDAGAGEVIELCGSAAPPRVPTADVPAASLPPMTLGQHALAGELVESFRIGR
jgi:hypothetical protein